MPPKPLAVFATTLLLTTSPVLAAGGATQAAREIETAVHLAPNLENGKEVYQVCAVCHMPEGWGQKDGYYPQIAGQLFPVIIKQLADIRARNRDAPTMLPFTMLENLTLQQMADVSAYIERLPMSPDNGKGPGTDLQHGERLYKENCADCHGHSGEGKAAKFSTRIQGQHYAYLLRQFEGIRTGKRLNGNQEMQEQILGFSERDTIALIDFVSRLQPTPSRLAGRDWRNPDFPRFVRPHGPQDMDGNEL